VPQLVARFGGPAGSIETYLEVLFTLDERTSIPDGVIRVARGGRIWTALLEVKTGTSVCGTSKVERYLDLARQQGYDAVITLSNALAPMGGAHPPPQLRRNPRLPRWPGVPSRPRGPSNRIRTCPSRKDFWAWLAYAICTALPECDSRSANIHSFTTIPAITVRNSPK
jgi:hypothetical protein